MIENRALALLASCPDGCTGAVMAVHGFTIVQLVELVTAGLAITTAGRIGGGEIARMRITAAGLRGNRRLIEAARPREVPFHDICSL